MIRFKGLLSSSLSSIAQGLRQIRDYVGAYESSPAFCDLIGEARALVAQLSAIRYDIVIRGLQIEVRPHSGAPDYGAQVAALFDRFDRAGSKDYAFDFGKGAEVNAVEGSILNLVAETHPDVFRRLRDFCKTATSFQKTATRL